MEVGELDHPRTATSLYMHPRRKRRQGHAHVRWMGGHALFTGAEDRMDTVQTVARRAAAAGLALVARHRGVVEVIATGALQQVAAGTGHVA